MNKIFFLGVNHTTGKGGVSSVLHEYSKIFSHATFISTTDSSYQLVKIYYAISALLKCFFFPLLYPKAIYHIHGASYNSFSRKYLFYKILSFFKVKIIYHVHGGEFHLFYANSDGKKKKKIKELINNVNGLICLSTFWEDFFIREFNPKNVKVIPNIVTDPIFIQRPNNKNKIEFLFLGYISESKGIWLLLDVLESLKDMLEGKIIFNIGGNGEVEKLHELVKQKKLEGIVNYIGWVSDEKKNQYLNQSDAYILPSYNEGLPISILEAMTYKLPIISTNVGGIPEVLKDKVNGLLIEPGSKKELKDALEFVINNTSEFKKFGENSLQFVKPHLPEKVKKELSSFYCSL